MANTSQAEFAAKQVREGGVLQIGDNPLDDGVAAVIGFGVQHRQRRFEVSAPTAWPTIWLDQEPVRVNTA